MSRTRALGLLLLPVVLLWSVGEAVTCTDPPRPVTLPQATVLRVVDGDTVDVQLDDQQERIRLIGIDTPESRLNRKLKADVQRSGQDRETILTQGKEASAFTKQRLTGATVGLDFDVQPRDRHGRMLAYIWTLDGRLFNLVLVREGYAQVMTIPPNVKYSERFLACQREAREQNKGLWRAPR